MKKMFLIINFLSSFIFAQTVFINEFHYDNVGTDTGEFLEIAGPAGFDVTGWSIVRYNGATGLVYSSPSATEVFSGSIPDQQNSYGTIVINYPQDGLQNGSPDGFALVNDIGTVIQFLSYEGTFSASDGPANGLSSIDVGVQESTSTLVGTSISLQGTGPFTWASGVVATPGSPNTGQVLPVEISSFSAIVLNNAIKLNWRTETEVNNYGFEIERSQMSNVNGQTEWQKLGFVEGNGNSNSPKDYTFVDEKVLAGKYQYRLKQIDTDGQFEYSKTIEVNFGSPNKIELSQNYPNPFNPTTTISFSLPQSGNVTLKVYNTIGQQVAELVNGYKEAGVHTVNFSASDFNSGVYFYRLETESFSELKKMILVK